jgi:phosphatidylinositol 4-kinase
LRRPLESFFDTEGTLDAQLITLMIWKYRNNQDFVHDFTDALVKFSDEQTVFEEIEFYLPQLAHMIIHLEVDWPNKALERFALVACQHSLHVALQVSSQCRQQNRMTYRHVCGS